MRRIATASNVLLLASTGILLGVAACGDNMVSPISLPEEIAPPATVMSGGPVLGPTLASGETVEVGISVLVPPFPPPPVPTPSLTLAVNPGMEWIESVTPPFPYQVSSGEVVNFTIVVAPPANTEDGIYQIQISVIFLGSQIGFRTVTIVVDTTAPVITLLGTDPVNLEVGDAYTDEGATADDNIDGDISGSIITVNPVDTNVPDIYTVTYNVSDAAGNPADEVTRTVTVVEAPPSPPSTDTPRATAEATLDNLSPFVGESKKLKNAVRDLNRSLEARLWLDDFHLAARQGNRVFDRQKNAIKDLMNLLKRPRGVSAEALAAALDAIDELVPANRLLAQTALDDLDGVVASNPRRQNKVNREMAKAQEDLDKGDAEATAGKFNKAIDYYKKAWRHAINAAKEAAK